MKARLITRPLAAVIASVGILATSPAQALDASNVNDCRVMSNDSRVVLDYRRKGIDLPAALQYVHEDTAEVQLSPWWRNYYQAMTIDAYAVDLSREAYEVQEDRFAEYVFRHCLTTFGGVSI